MILRRILLFLTGLFAISAMAAGSYEAPDNASHPTMEKVVISRYLTDGTIVTDTVLSPREIFVDSGLDSTPLSARRGKKYFKPVDKSLRPFMAGLELSTSLDLSGTDLSTFNADLLMGYRKKVIQLLGVSMGIHKSLGSHDCFIPLQVIFRTGFTSRPTPVFMQFSAGYSFNTISRSPMFGDFIATLGCGVNLVQTRKFQSNIVAAFGFRHLTERHQEMTRIQKPNLGFAQISFGISM